MICSKEVKFLIPLLSRQALVSTMMKTDEYRVEKCSSFQTIRRLRLSEEVKKGKVSSLMDKELKYLEEINWNEIVNELKSSLHFC